MRLAAVLLTLVASPALAQATPPPATPPAAQATEPSTFVVRCTEDCTVRVDGKPGLRKDTRTWEFRDVAPGKRRVEATGGFLNRPLFTGYAEVPGGMRVVAQIDQSRRLTITGRTPLVEDSATQAAAGAPSLLNIRCPKACSVFLDGGRQGAAASQNIVVREVTPGEHKLEAKFVLGTKVVRSVVAIPAASEVFITATESGISITNTKPLSP